MFSNERGGWEFSLSTRCRSVNGTTEDDGSDSTKAANGDDQDEAPTCTAAALVPGAIVEEADLTISSAGATWSKVELAS